MRKQRPKTKISSAEHRWLTAFIFCLTLSFLLGCATGSTEGPFFFSSEHSRRPATEGNEAVPEDLPSDSGEDEELRRLAEEEAARIAMEERLAEEQRLAEEEAQRLAEEEAARKAEEQRLAEEEAQRLAEEEAARKAQQEQQEARAAAERERQAAEAQKLAEEQRLAEEEAARKARQEQQETTEETQNEEFTDEETETLEPAGDEMTPPALPEEPIEPDFVLTAFKDQEIKVVLEGEGWIMANPGPAISFLRKEYSPTGQSIFYLKAAEDGEYMLFYSRSAAVGIEKKAVLLKIVPEEGTPATTEEATTEEQKPVETQPAPAPQQSQQQPQAPAVVRQPGEPAADTQQQTSPAAPQSKQDQQPDVPSVPAVPQVPQVPATPSVPAPEGSKSEPVQPPAVVRDLTTPEAPTKEPSDNVDVPVPPTSTPPTQSELNNLEEKALKDTFDALRSNPNDQISAIKVGEAFLQRFGRSNLAAEVLYYLGQIYETPGPNVDRQKAYDYYSRAYNDYPISPYSRKSKERMNYLEQFYLRLP